MGVKIVSAMFGDETVSRDVTKQLNERAKGGEVSVVADSSLLPMFEAVDTVQLSNADKQDIRDKALQECGGGSDTNCVAARTDALTRTRFQEKQKEVASTANQVKGRRLTVVVDDNGTKRTLVVPDGSKFELEGVESPPEPWDFSAANVAWKTLTTGTTVAGYIGMLIAAFLYVFQIFATADSLQTLESLGPFNWKYYLGLATSILVPYSGFLILGALYIYRGYSESSA